MKIVDLFCVNIQNCIKALDFSEVSLYGEMMQIAYTINDAAHFIHNDVMFATHFGEANTS